MAVGHSYVAGGSGIAGPHERWSTRLAAVLGMAEVNRGLGGARCAYPGVAAGGWARALREPTVGGAAVVPIMFGVNDANDYDSPARFGHALRTVISRNRAARVFEESHPSCSFEGAWRVEPAPDHASGAACMLTEAPAGAAIRIVTPRDFPGGTIALGFTLAGQGDATAGGVHAVTVDGTAAARLDTRDLGPLGGPPSRDVVGAVIRLDGLAAGERDIAVTFPLAPRTVRFDYWQIEAAEPPLVLLLHQPLLDAGGYAAYAVPALSDARIVALNETLDGIAAEFLDGRVATVALSALDRSFASGLMAPDLVHPSAAGHAVIAGLVEAAIRGAGGGPR